MPIGPSLPPHLLSSNAGPSQLTNSTTPPYPAPESDDEADDFGPALPPHLAAARAGPPRTSAGPQRPTVGPARPAPELLDYAAQLREEVDSDDDDEVGPKFVPSIGGGEKSAAEEFMEREARWAKEREEAAKPKILKREEWMLVPPEAGDLAAATDPLRKRPTAFNRTSAPAVTAKDQTLWTETPAEKLQRIQDEVMGKKRKAEVGVKASIEDEDEESRRKRKRDREIKKSIEKHNTSHRAASLLELHSKAKKESKDEEKPPAIWDRDRDMGVTGRLLSDPERLQKIKDAKGLNDRFGHGKAGAFSM